MAVTTTGPLLEGVQSLSARVSDAAGNVATSGTLLAVTVDGTAPEGGISATDDGTAGDDRVNANDTVTFALDFGEAVYVDAPTLP